jgi:hypothetical protein
VTFKTRKALSTTESEPVRAQRNTPLLPVGLLLASTRFWISSTWDG